MVKTTLELLDDINWICPNKIIVEIYEIEVLIGDYNDMRRGRLNKKIINEMYIPEFDLGINNENGSNIIPNVSVSSRYDMSKTGSKLINTIEITDCKELFDIICIGVKAKNLGPKISQLFDSIKITNN